MKHTAVLLLLLSLDHYQKCEACHSTIPTQALHDDLPVGHIYCPSLVLRSHSHGVPRIKPLDKLPVTSNARHIYENCAHHNSLMLYHVFAANFFACFMTSARPFTQGSLHSWQSTQLACVQRFTQCNACDRQFTISCKICI